MRAEPCPARSAARANPALRLMTAVREEPLLLSGRTLPAVPGRRPPGRSLGLAAIRLLPSQPLVVVADAVAIQVEEGASRAPAHPAPSAPAHPAPSAPAHPAPWPEATTEAGSDRRWTSAGTATPCGPEPRARTAPRAPHAGAGPRPNRAGRPDLLAQRAHPIAQLLDPLRIRLFRGLGFDQIGHGAMEVPPQTDGARGRCGSRAGLLPKGRLLASRPQTPN